MSGCGAQFPSVFKEGWLRLNKKVPFLSGADGVVSKFQQKLRCATRIFIRRLCDLLLTTPSAPLRNGIFLLMAQPPLLENGGEWTRLATNPSHPASQPVGQFWCRTGRNPRGSRRAVQNKLGDTHNGVTIDRRREFFEQLNRPPGVLLGEFTGALETIGLLDQHQDLAAI